MHSHRAGVFDVLLRGTIGEWHFLIHPCSDIGARDFVALLFEEPSRDGAVDTARERYKDFLHLRDTKSSSSLASTI